MHRTTTRTRRLLTIPLLSLALVAGVSAPAQAVPTDTTVTIQVKRSSTAPADGDGVLGGVYYDGVGPAIPEDTFVVSGRLTEDTGGAGLAGETVTLFRSAKTADDFTAYRSTTTDEEGRYEFRLQVKGSAAYGVRYAGNEELEYNPVDSEESVANLAMRDFNARKRKVNGKLFFRGDINPGWGGRTVTLQKKACGTCAWRSVASKKAGSRGAWSFRVYYPKAVGPVWRWQAVISGAGDFEKSFSGQLTTRTVYGREPLARVR